MRLETLAKRLAQKTNTPILEQVILGQANLEELPATCMIWTGAKNGDGIRMRTSRNSKRGILVERVVERAYGVINWQGKRTSVARLVFQLTQKPDYEFSLWNCCGVGLCVNPRHYQVKTPVVEIEAQEGSFYVGTDEDIPEDELEELIEIMLLNYDPRSWDDVASAEILEGISHEQIRGMLLKMNKEHLT